MLGINGGELVVILVIAVIVIGPERLPQYAEQLARGVRRIKVLLQDAKSRVDEELGPEFQDVDWSKLDPRQYDPRRIVRDALLDDPPVTSGPTYRTGLTRAAAAAGVGAAGGAASAGGDRPTSGSPAPFDDEAT